MVLEAALGLFRVFKALKAAVIDPWRMRPVTVVNVISVVVGFNAGMGTFDDGAGADGGNGGGRGKQIQGY
jgi:uncharacterized spore protein YtfJ